MTTSYKVLGQVAPAAATLTDIYTVPAANSAVISTLAACNTGLASTTIRIAIRPGGAAANIKHYIVYDTPVSTGDSLFFTIGTTLAATDVVSVYANLATVSFSAFGSETY